MVLATAAISIERIRAAPSVIVVMMLLARDRGDVVGGGRNTRTTTIKLSLISRNKNLSIIKYFI